MTHVPYTCDPIIIVGVARSGTSMMANLLHSYGVQCGPTVKNGVTNLWDCMTTRTLMVEMFRNYGIDAVNPLGGIIQYPDVSFQMRKRLFNCMNAQGLDTSYPWLIKHNWISRCWQTFDDAFPSATWIICERDIEKNIEAMKRSFLMRIQYWHSVDLHAYCEERQAINRTIQKSVSRGILINTSTVLDEGNPFSVYDPLIEYLGFEPCDKQHLYKRQRT